MVKRKRINGSVSQRVSEKYATPLMHRHNDAMTQSVLALIRHGESEWNAKGLWTGWTDVNLTKRGRQEARNAALLIRGLSFHIGFTSKLVRARQTLDEILQILGIQIPIIDHPSLNERHYGIHTGKNKWDVKKQVGDEEFMKIRRSWNYPIPQGESLKDVHNRVVPYYQMEIHRHIVGGNNVLVVAHGNSLRALVKHLEDVPDDKISQVEIATGEVLLYHFNPQGRVLKKESRK